MKKFIYILIALTVLLAGYYLYTYWALGNDSAGQVNSGYLTYRQSDVGLEFDYPEGSEGYVLIDKKVF